MANPMKKFKLVTRAKSAGGIVDAFYLAYPSPTEARFHVAARALCLASYDIASAAYAGAEALGVIDTDIFETALFAMSESLVKDDKQTFVHILGGPHEISDTTRQHMGDTALEAVIRFDGYAWCEQHPERSLDEKKYRIRSKFRSCIDYALSASARYFDKVRYGWKSDGGVGYNSAQAAELYGNMMTVAGESADAANSKMINLYKRAIEKAVNSLLFD